MFPGRGERIRIAREARGLSQEELGDAIGSSQGTVSEWEKDDERRIQRSNLKALARELRTTEEWLQRGTGQPPTLTRERPERPYISVSGGKEEAAARLDALTADLTLLNLIQPADAAQLRDVAARIRGEEQGQELRREG